MERLRAEYLFLLADICGLSAQDVDDLWFIDFLAYVDGCKARQAMREKWAEDGGVWVA